MNKSRDIGYKHGLKGSTNAYAPGARKGGTLFEYNFGFAEGSRVAHESSRETRMQLARLNIPRILRKNPRRAALPRPAMLAAHARAVRPKKAIKAAGARKLRVRKSAAYVNAIMRRNPVKPKKWKPFFDEFTNRDYIVLTGAKTGRIYARYDCEYTPMITVKIAALALFKAKGEAITATREKF
jgi:hypothetical protein